MAILESEKKFQITLGNNGEIFITINQNVVTNCGMIFQKATIEISQIEFMNEIEPIVKTFSNYDLDSYAETDLKQIEKN